MRGIAPDHWFEPVADHLGAAYLRYSFTKGTGNEVDFLVGALALEPGMRLLDVGCGPGRHAYELAQRDAPPGASFVRADARRLPEAELGEFDAAISLCQGAFGLAGGPGAPLDADGEVLDGIAASLRPGGITAVSAFSAYFQVRFLEDSDTFDAAAGVNHEHTVVKDEAGVEAAVDLWTTCFTPRELRLLAERAGLEVRHVWSVTPGDYAERAPDIDHPELLLVAERPR